MITHTPLLYFDPNAQFKISPDMPPSLCSDFQIHIQSLQKRPFFWAYDPASNLITPSNESITDVDILDQITSLAFWLYGRGHTLDGSILFRIDHMIHFIETDKDIPSIKYHIIYDPIDLRSVKTDLLSHTNHKLKKYHRTSITKFFIRGLGFVGLVAIGAAIFCAIR